MLVSGEQTSLQTAGGGEDELNALIGDASFDRNGTSQSVLSIDGSIRKKPMTHVPDSWAS